MTSSNGGTISTKEVIAYSEYLQLSAYCQMAACALVFYEHLTTFSQEIHLVWNHKITGAAITLLVNRYLVLIYGIINVFSVINWTTSSVLDLDIHFLITVLISIQFCRCEIVFLLHCIMEIILFVVVPGVSSLRVYAISGKKLYLALIVLILGFVPVVTNLYNYIESAHANPLYTGNLPVFNITAYGSHMTNMLVIFTRSCAIASDVIVLLITWWNTYKLKIEARKANLKPSLGSLLLRDGTLYFGSIMSITIIELMILTIARQDDQQQYAECIAVFIAPISTILVSRFMMNLRHLSYFNENCTFSSFLHSFYQDFSLNIYESDHPTCNIKHKDVLNASEAFVVTSEEVHNCLNGSDLIERVNRSSDNVQIEEVELCTFLQT